MDVTNEQNEPNGISLIVKEDMICPLTKYYCDDECCTVGSTCNLVDSVLTTGYYPNVSNTNSNVANVTNDRSQAYIGTKIVKAYEMVEYEFLRLYKGKTKAELDNIETHGDGYLVEYEDGYKSWSPKSTFERSYRKLTIQEKNLIL